MTLNDLRPYLRPVLPSAIALAVIVAAYWVSASYLTDRINATDRQLNQVQRDTRGLRQQIQQLSSNQDFVADNLDGYRRAVEAGFVGAQDRLQASETIEQLALQADLNEVRYEFREKNRIELETTGDIQAYLVSTVLVLNIGALLDRNVFAFLDEIRLALPGYVVVRTLAMNRTQATDTELVTRLEEGERPRTLDAAVTLDWITLEITETGDATNG